jgi:hypothetical protein
VKPTIVVPVHPSGSSNLDFLFIMPWPAGLNQLRFVDSYGGFRERVVVRVTDRPDRRVNTRSDEMLSEPE